MTAGVPALESTGFGSGRIVVKYNPEYPEKKVYDRQYFITDHLGSVRVVFDQSGEVLARNDYYPFGKQHDNPALTVPNNPADNRFLFNGKEKQLTGGLNLIDYGWRMYDFDAGRWLGIDKLTEKYYPVSPYIFTLNNPINGIDSDGRDVVAISKAAQRAILNTLPKDVRSSVVFNEKGVIDRAALNSASSNSGNFAALSQLVNDDRTFEVSVTDKMTYKDENGNMIEKSLGPIGMSDDKNGFFGFNTGETGWIGVTQSPGDAPNKYNSPDDNVKVVVNSGLSEAGQAQAFAHEGYGHALLLSQGKPSSHQYQGTEEGLKDNNTTLVNAINDATKETIENMKNL